MKNPEAGRDFAANPKGRNKKRRPRDSVAVDLSCDSFVQKINSDSLSLLPYDRSTLLPDDPSGRTFTICTRHVAFYDSQ